MIRNGTAPMPRSTAGTTPGCVAAMLTALSLWLLGYPDQAVASSQAALALAQQLAHPFSLTLALYWAAMLHHLRREAPLTQARAEAAMTIATDQGFPQQFAQATPLRGWALAASGHGEEGITQIQQGLAAYRATGATRDRPYYLALLAEASAQVGQTAEGLEALAEALATLAKSRARWWEAELHRLRGELLLQHASGTARGGGSLLPAGPRRGSPPAGQVSGAAGRHESGSPVAAPGQAHRSSPTAGGGVWLVH